MATHKLKILVIDDEVSVLRVLERDLTDMGCDVSVANGGTEGLRLYFESAYDLVLVDLRMPEPDGLAVMEKILAEDVDAQVVMMTAYGSVDLAVEAIKAGATDFLAKPLDETHLNVVIDRAVVKHQRALKLEVLEAQMIMQGSFEGMVGVSAGMRAIYDNIRRVAPGDSTILVQGETGTGKELVVRAIHYLSSRKARPFVPINCGALTESLLETELFGHERGAFTGANVSRQGLLEQASGGTLFLDEVEAMSAGLQARLLRVLQDGEVRRVGGNRMIKTDFRLLAATNQDLHVLAEAGAFRLDLFYRLNVITLDLPPLRSRQADIPLLVQHFVATWCERHHRVMPHMTSEAMMALRAYDWPGNVRELENVIDRLLVLGDALEIGIDDLPDDIVGKEDILVWDLPLKDAVGKFEHDYLERKLLEAEGRVADAARRAGIRRERFYEKMRRHDIQRKDIL